jgi:hypothetical protein
VAGYEVNKYHVFQAIPSKIAKYSQKKMFPAFAAW